MVLMNSIDSFLPAWDINELHTTTIAASPEAVIAAARDMKAREVPLLVVLMAIRGLPALLSGKWKTGIDRPLLGEFRKSGFVLMVDGDRELVLGAVGRFWKPAGEIRRIDPADFTAFGEPGYAKAAFDMRAEPAPEGGTTLSTETRIGATDSTARRNFRRYWRIIGPGSAAIRVMWLRAIKRRAERPS